MGLWIFGEVTNGTVHWEPDPTNRRGTWTILVSCIITLTLCVYTSLHLNIPARRSSRATIFGMKAKYVIFGLLAPELVVFNAWRQRTVATAIAGRIRKERGGKTAKPWLQRFLGGLRSWPRKALQGIKSLPSRLARRWKKRQREKRLPTHIDDEDPWADIGLILGFYIVMGGYALDISKATPPSLWPLQVDRLTLSSRAVLACLISEDRGLRDLLPFLSEEEIWDKSKANGLAKTIVCIQALWFCLQCIVRLAQGIPISLLELNTFAHALCALVVYLLWWDKPLDAQEPTAIDASKSDVARNVCAFGWSGPQGPVAHFRRVYPSNDLSWVRTLVLNARATAGLMKYHLGEGALVCTAPDRSAAPKYKICAEVSNLDRPLFLPRQPPQFKGLTSDERNSCVWISSDPPVFSLRGGEQIPSTAAIVSRTWSTVEIDESFLERIRTVENLRNCSNYAAYETAFSRILDSVDPDHSMLKRRELNFTDSLMRQASDVSRVSKNFAATSGILLSGILYGGLHMAAWGSTTFSTSAEQTAWKVACCIVAFGGLFTILGIWGLDVVNEMTRRTRWRTVFKIVVYFSVPIHLAFFLLYLASRVYLVVEVFRNLAFLDDRVYQTPDWSTYFPYIA